MACWHWAPGGCRNFGCDWLPCPCPQVSLYTSDIRGAGTDDNISIELHGDKVRVGGATMRLLKAYMRPPGT
mgnify:CR=1 FL=1